MKGRKADLGDSDCGIARALQVVGDRWTLLIIREAFQGRQRFGEFQKSLGLAKNILSARLKKLVDDGVFEIHPDEETAVSHRYVLTPMGEDLCVILIALWQWGAAHRFQPGELKSEMVDNRKGEPLPELKLRARDGQAIGPRDFRRAARAPGRGPAAPT